MEITIDIEELRSDLKDLYGTGAYNGFPAMISETWLVDQMNDQEVAQKALDSGFDLFRYQV